MKNEDILIKEFAYLYENVSSFRSAIVKALENLTKLDPLTAKYGNIFLRFALKKELNNLEPSKEEVKKEIRRYENGLYNPENLPFPVEKSEYFSKDDLKLIKEFGIDALLSAIYTKSNKNYLQIISDIENHSNCATTRDYLVEKKNKTIDSRLKHIYAFSDEQTSNKKLNNLVSFRFFDDLTRNVRISIQSLEKFEENYKHLIPQDIQHKIDNLKQVEEFFTREYEMEEADFNKLYSEFKKINWTSDLYDCIDFAKRTVTTDLTESLTDIKKLTPVDPSNTDIRFKNKFLKVYDLRDKNYRLLVNNTEMHRLTPPNQVKQVKTDRNCSQSPYDSISLSYVGDQSLVTFYDLKERLTFCYYDVKPEDIIHITEEDNYTNFHRGHDKVSSFRFSMMTPDELLEYCKKNKVYNEVNGFAPVLANESFLNFNNDQDNLQYNKSFKKPQAIFCLDKITPYEEQVAEKLDIPIIVVSGRDYQYYGVCDQNLEVLQNYESYRN